VERLATACEILSRQWRSGHPPGHDAVLELHRALKAVVPELARRSLCGTIRLDKLESAAATIRKAAAEEYPEEK